MTGSKDRIERPKVKMVAAVLYQDRWGEWRLQEAPYLNYYPGGPFGLVRENELDFKACGCEVLNSDGSLLTCTQHQTKGEKKLLKEAVEIA